MKVAGFMRLGNDKGTSGSEYTTKLVQTGGSVDVAGDLAIGHYRYLNAFYEISGGTLNVLNYNSAAMSGLWMAVDGNGTLAISGGEVNAGRINLNARDDELKGTLTMTGGVLNVGSGGIMATIVGDERYDINLEGGTITSGKVIAGSANFAENGSWSSDLDIKLTSAANPVVFETLGTSQIALNGAISGGGGLEKTGTGTLIMSGQNTYAGTTTVTEGKVQLSGGTLAGEIVVAEGATLAAAGAVGLKDLDVTGEFEVTPGLTKFSLTEGAVFHDGSLLTIADGHAQDWGTYDIVLAGEGFEVVHDTAWDTFNWEALLSPELRHDWNLTLNAGRSILTLGTDFDAIPEPATWVLLLLCAVGLPAVMRRAHLGQA